MLFAILLVLGSMNLAHAGNDDGNGNGGQNNGNQYGRHNDPAAPELDPSALGSGLVILVGGIVILQERRRLSNKNS